MTTYTTSLRLAKQATAENDKVWGSVNNAQIDLVDTAIAGASSIDVSAGDVTLTALNGAADQARAMTILVTGAPASARNIVVPKAQKLYTVHNACGQTVTVKTATGTGLAIPNGTRYSLFVDSSADRVFGFVLHTEAAVASGPGTLTTVACSVAAATAGTTNPTYYTYKEGNQIVVGTDGFTVTVNSIAFSVLGSFPDVAFGDFDTFPIYVDEAGTTKAVLAAMSPSGPSYSHADSTAWTATSSRIVPPHYFTMRGA